MEKDDKLYLEMALDHLIAIDQYKPKTQEEFVKNHQARDAILLRLQAFGEIMNHIGDDFRSQHPDWPWHQSIALRHIISHDYFAVSDATIWALIDGEELKKLHNQVADLVNH